MKQSFEPFGTPIILKSINQLLISLIYSISQGITLITLDWKFDFGMPILAQ